LGFLRLGWHGVEAVAFDKVVPLLNWLPFLEVATHWIRPFLANAVSKFGAFAAKQSVAAVTALFKRHWRIISEADDDAGVGVEQKCISLLWGIVCCFCERTAARTKIGTERDQLSMVS